MTVLPGSFLSKVKNKQTTNLLTLFTCSIKLFACLQVTLFIHITVKYVACLTLQII